MLMWAMGLPIGGVLATENAVIPYAVRSGYRMSHEDDSVWMFPSVSSS